LANDARLSGLRLATRTPLDGWPSSSAKTAPSPTKPSAFCDCEGIVAMNCRSRISSNGFPAKVATSCGALQPCDPVHPITRTISSLGPIVARKTSTPVM